MFASLLLIRVEGKCSANDTQLNLKISHRDDLLIQRKRNDYVKYDENSLNYLNDLNTPTTLGRHEERERGGGIRK